MSHIPMQESANYSHANFDPFAFNALSMKLVDALYCRSITSHKNLKTGTYGDDMC